MFIYILALLLVLIVVQYRRTYSYWSSRNVKGPFPFPFVGTILYHLWYKESRQADWAHLQKFGKVFGEYSVKEPNLLISDAKLAKQILVTDFHIFNQARKPFNGTKPIPALTDLHGPEWKRIRSAVSPTFTTGKLRQTVEHLNLPIQNFFENLDNLIDRGEADKIQIKELSKGYAMDVIAKFVFAVQVNSFKQKEDPFVQNVFRMIQIKPLLFVMALAFPGRIGKYLMKYVTDLKANEYFQNLTKEVIKQRRANTELKYKDFIELLIESGKDLTEDEMVVQCITFFFAGLETVSSAISSIMSDIAIHQDVQEKLLKEISDKLGDGQLTYDNVQELEYLDALFHESLRMTPVIGRLVRTPQSDYKLGDTGILVEAHKSVMFSVHNIHHDDKVYDEPFQFRPERFMGDSKKDLQNHYWYAFGNGPRNCVAIRFATMECKFFLVNLIRKYEIRMAKGSPVPVEFQRIPFMMIAKDLRIDFKRRN